MHAWARTEWVHMAKPLLRTSPARGREPTQTIHGHVLLDDPSNVPAASCPPAACITDHPSQSISSQVTAASHHALEEKVGLSQAQMARAEHGRPESPGSGPASLPRSNAEDSSSQSGPQPQHGLTSSVDDPDHVWWGASQPHDTDRMQADAGSVLRPEYGAELAEACKAIQMLYEPPAPTSSRPVPSLTGDEHAESPFGDAARHAVNLNGPGLGRLGPARSTNAGPQPDPGGVSGRMSPGSTVNDGLSQQQPKSAAAAVQPNSLSGPHLRTPLLSEVRRTQSGMPAGHLPLESVCHLSVIHEAYVTKLMSVALE